jgi:virulence-associated protein VagC
MSLLHRTTLTQVGNSQAVIIPRKYLTAFNFSVKSKVDLFETADGLLIKPVDNKLDEFMQRQHEIIANFINSADDDEYIDPDEFIAEYCTDNNSDDWERLGF